MGTAATLIVVAWAVLAPAAALLLGLAKGIEYGEARGAADMRRSMLNHPAIKQRVEDKRPARTA